MKRLLLFILPFSLLFSDNQSDVLSPVLPEDSLPFSIQLETAAFTLPSGIQGQASGIYSGKWLLIAGRTNGLHGFDNVGNNFPPAFQNRTVYVVDPETGNSWSRSMLDPSSGLSVEEIDTLSVVAPQFFYQGRNLYLVGGYGINTATGLMETKSTLTVIDMKKMMRWVMHGTSSAKKAIRQVSDPLLQVTGGALVRHSAHDPFLLILGQNFAGLYTPGTNGVYTQQVRPFWLNEEEGQLSILPHIPSRTYPDYRRRDLNVVPVIQNGQMAYVALSGVFTITGGIWNVPITIFPDGSSSQQDPASFRQAMNNYFCPTFGLYSNRFKEMYTVLPGGLSYGYFSGGVFNTDSEVPFINQVTTIRIDKHDRYTQHLMNGEYPVILSTGSNPGNQLLFGAEAKFFPAAKTPLFRNRVIQFDALPKRPTVVGYIAAGIMSTLPNTTSSSDSTASPYIFKVIVIPKKLL